jgi:hypothetical protein
LSNNHFEEKRHFSRTNINEIVTYTLCNTSGITYQGAALNLSESGLYMTTDYPPEPDLEIDLIIKSQDPTQPLLAAHGKIVRCVTDESDCSLFHVSVELLAAN